MTNTGWGTFLICLLPFISFFLFQYLLNLKIVKKLIHVKTVDLMVPVLLYSVAILSDGLFEFSFFAYFIVGLLIVGILLLLFLAKKNGEIIYQKFFKTYWRIDFLITFVAYFVVMVVHLLKK